MSINRVLLLAITAAFAPTFEALQLLNEVLTPIGVGIGRSGLTVHNQPFTRTTLDKYLTLMEDNPEFIPMEAQQLIFDLTPQSRNQIVSYFNNVATGRTVIPNDQYKIADGVIRAIPELNDRYPEARITIDDRLACMTPNTRDQVMEWYWRAITTLSGNRQRLPNAIAGWAADVKAAFDQADDQTVNDIQRCEPEAFNLLTSDFIDYWMQKARLLATASNVAATGLGILSDAPNDKKNTPTKTEEDC
ncbi:hypothetical protein Q1695_016258 [Nippostrongylus brasiliensis]|nr:hypothetical protein Q1695_016258 [Nippostrongylus brasiliensis]